MSFINAWLFFCRRSISSEMSSADSSCTYRSSSILPSSSAIGCSNSRNVVLLIRFLLSPHRKRFEAAPQIPRGHAAPRRPGLCKQSDAGAPCTRVKQLDRFPVHVVEADRLQQTQVIERQHVRAEQIKDQKHLGCPATDATYRSQPLHDLVVGRALQHRDVEMFIIK